MGERLTEAQVWIDLATEDGDWTGVRLDLTAGEVREAVMCWLATNSPKGWPPPSKANWVLTQFWPLPSGDGGLSGATVVYRVPRAALAEMEKADGR